VTSALDIAGRRIYVAGHRGLVGSALLRRLAREPVETLTATHDELDLRDQAVTRRFLLEQKPDVVIVAAARVGGILANSSRPADFLYDNLMIAGNLIHAAHEAGVARLLFLGSSCIYPRLAKQPMAEDALLTGPLEPTNQWYAIAKIAGVKLCDAYREQHGRSYVSVMPTNLYGPGDNFDLDSSHVIPALMRKIDAATRKGSDVEIWGTGTPMREFMHVDDLADAIVFLLSHYDEAGPINAGTGEEISIGDLARLIGEVAGFRARFKFDPSKPDGTPRKLIDSSRLRALGWRPIYELRAGLEQTYAWYHSHAAGPNP
jgi:GDP-L-fucose synthase